MIKLVEITGPDSELLDKYLSEIHKKYGCEPIRNKSFFDKSYRVAFAMEGKQPVGFCIYATGSKKSNINEASILKTTKSLLDDDVDLAQIKGYNLFDGGIVARIGMMHSYEEKEGIGTMLINNIKSQDIDLIELANIRNEDFFKLHGFVRTELSGLDGNILVCSGNNMKLRDRPLHIN